MDEFVASSRVNQYERGVHAPDYATAQRLARALRITTAYLFADNETVAQILRAISVMPVAALKALARRLR